MKKNMIFLGCLLVLAGLVGLAEGGRTPSLRARVDGVDDDPQYILLDRDGTYPIWEGKLDVTLYVEDGKICFQKSECPDQICVESGWLQNVGDTATCLPAGVSVTIIEPEE